MITNFRGREKQKNVWNYAEDSFQAHFFLQLESAEICRETDTKT